MQIANPAGRDAEKDIAGRVERVSGIERCRWRRCVLQCEWNLVSVEAAFSGKCARDCSGWPQASRDSPIRSKNGKRRWPPPTEPLLVHKMKRAPPLSAGSLERSARPFRGGPV